MDTRLLRLLDKLNMNRRKAMVFGQDDSEAISGVTGNLEIKLAQNVIYITARNKEQCLDLRGLLEILPNIDRIVLENIDKVIVSNSYVIEFKGVSKGPGEVEIRGEKCVEAVIAYSHDTRKQTIYIWDGRFSKNGQWHTRKIGAGYDKTGPLINDDGSWLGWVDKRYRNKVAEASYDIACVYIRMQHGKLISLAVR